MGILPLEFPKGNSVQSLGLTGHEVFDIEVAKLYREPFKPARTVKVRARREGRKTIECDARVRIDTPDEAEYYRHSGMLRYVLRRLITAKSG